MTEQERIAKATEEINRVLQEYKVALQPKLVQVSGTLVISLTEVEIVSR